MCGRIIQASGPLRYQLVDGLDVPDSRLSSIPRRYNGAPSQELLVIRQNRETGERSLDLLRWGLVPSWSADPKGGPRPINAMAETVRSKPMFREAYRKRRCIVPVDGFFEWQAPEGGKQPYAIAMKNGAPLAFGKIGETR
jgi:putative SOS response-associated peptidase YedK